MSRPNDSSWSWPKDSRRPDYVETNGSTFGETVEVLWTSQIANPFVSPAIQAKMTINCQRQFQVFIMKAF